MDLLPPDRLNASRFRLPSALSGILAGLLLTGTAVAQSARPDKVFWTNARGQVTTMTGSITENSLTALRIDRSGKEQKIDGSSVVQVVWGAVPPAFRDGTTYRNRADFENAVSKFRVAAGDAAARDVVKAEARFLAAESLLEWGAHDANQFAECAKEAERFLTDYPANRSVPEARQLKARATLLTGDAATAAQDFKALYAEGANDPPTTGYEREFCLKAGLDAAEAFLHAGDTLAARELYTALESSFASMVAEIQDESSPDRHRLLGLQGEASVGEGFCMLASGQEGQAVTFFQGRLARGEALSAERFAATLGLGEAYLARNMNRLAQFEFAKVSAIDHTDRDRVARALVGLADSSLKLQDKDAAVTAKKWLTQVRDFYGNTPSAKKAAELF